MDWRVSVEHVVTADSHAEAVYDFWSWLGSVADIDAYTEAVPIIDPAEEWPPPRAEDCVIRKTGDFWFVPIGCRGLTFGTAQSALRYVGAF